MRKLNIDITHRPKHIVEHAWYIVRYRNILKPQLLWHIFSTKQAAQDLLDKNRLYIKSKDYRVIYGKWAIKYELKFTTLGALRNKSEYSPILRFIKYPYPKEAKTPWKKELFRQRYRRYKEKNQKNYLSKQ